MSVVDTVEVVELMGRRVVFLSRHKLPVGETCWVRMAVRDSQGWLHIRPVPVVLERDRNIRVGQTAYVGSLPPDESLQPLLSSVNTPCITRRNSRQSCCLRVLAPELGLEEAWAVDFSLSGVQIRTSEPLEPGAIVHLQLYTPGSTLLPIDARVAWCRSHPQEGCRAGLEFRDPPPYLQRELRYLQDRLSQGTA